MREDKPVVAPDDASGGTDPPDLVGRSEERARISGLLLSVRQGMSAALVLRGDPGVGKSALLADAIEQAHDFTVVRFVAVESEMQLGFAALHALLIPVLGGLDSLPAPQEQALKAAFGMSDDAAPDPFIVGLAALTLLSAAADHRLLIVVDDAQWLDQESANAVAFVARRLHADRVGLLIAVRESETAAQFRDLPGVDIHPLTDEASRQLLRVTAAAPLSPQVEDRVVAEAGGNPLGLVELVRELSSDQRAGVAVLPEPFHIDRRLETRFLRQVRSLPEDSQRLLVAVAADPTGDVALILRAGQELGFDESAIDPAVAADLLDHGTSIGFRHSVIRSAVYQGATEADRRRAHDALASATDVDRDPDRRAWHRAAAAVGPDEDVAEELEQAASRAQSHGSHAATSALFERAAELTPDRDRRALRLLLAAVAALTAGNSAHAHSTVSRAIEDIDDPILRAQARRVQAAALFLEFLPEAADGRASAGRHDEIMSIMLDTVRDVAPLDVHLARETILDALPMAVFFGGTDTNTVNDAALLARSLELPPDLTPTTADLMLDAMAMMYVHGGGQAVPALRRALQAVQTDADLRATPHTLSFGCWVGFGLGDDQAVQDLAGELIESSRTQGALQVLPQTLNHLGQSELRMGRLAAADACFAEQREIEALSGRHVVADVAQLMVAAWRGRQDDVRSAATVLTKQVTDLRIGLLFDWIQWSLMTLELGVGNYRVAARLPLHDLGTNLAIDPFKAVDEVEAHVRGGDLDVATNRLEWLADRALANQSPLELGLLARGRALVADDQDAERWYQESCEQLAASGAGLHLARTQLLYGEWLRRQNRRLDARRQLEPALGTFESTGARTFADRTRAELQATGHNARKRVDETRNELTPQEEQIAHLAAGGATNPEIASRLFISPSTVDYHLRKVYRKLNISSRRQLAQLESARSSSDL